MKSVHFHTGDGRDAGEGLGACDLNTNHIVAAGLQSSEAVVVEGGTIHREWVVRAQLSVEQGHAVQVRVLRIILHPSDQ